ncbi:MAG: hypothetical protein IPM27_02570 [Nitrosomonadales bacterium]|nr:hypothetical protein [Nitrosomonadales bacterium]
MKSLLVCLVLLLSSAPSWAELEVIALKHRSAEELLPVIRPLLDKDAVASGMNYQLILRTSPQNLEQIHELLQHIDVAPRRLKITVLQDVDSDTVTRLTEVSGSVGVGREARVSVPGSGGTGGLTVEAGRGEDRLKARIERADSVTSDHKTQQLQVLEGSRAFVRTGQSVPIPQRHVILYPGATQVIDTTQYQEVGSGFYVLPRVNGDRVTLEISTQNDAPGPDQGGYPTTRIQRADTTVAGRLGEWLAVGGVDRQQAGQSGGIGTRGDSAGSERRKVLLKVEEAD